MVLVCKNFGYTISYYQLRNLYIRHNIRYKKTQWQYR
jgi:hypothetical protein